MAMRSFALLAVLTVVSAVRAEDKEPVTAEQVMQLVRMSYALQEGKLSGKLRENTRGDEEPFTLTMQQQIIRFVFPNAKHIVNLDLGTAPPTLREVKPGASTEVPLEKYSEKVLNFDINYEDLSLRFLYWPNPQIIGEENLGTFTGQKAWKVRITSPDGRGPYGTVDVWVHQGSGGMAKMEGWDKAGNLIRRYSIKEFHKVGKAYVPAQMRLDSIDPTNPKKVTGHTYMEFDKPKQ
jgi:hypothetical protein